MMATVDEAIWQLHAYNYNAQIALRTGNYSIYDTIWHEKFWGVKRPLIKQFRLEWKSALLLL